MISIINIKDKERVSGGCTRRFGDLFSVSAEAKEKLSAVVASMEVNRAPEVISRLKHIHGVMYSILPVNNQIGREKGLR